MNSRLEWDTHIDSIATRANRALAFLRRNLRVQSKAVKEKAYKAFARPVLEYAASVWEPYSKTQIDKLEAVQRRAARFVSGDYRYSSSVSKMLMDLKWPTLQQRRRRIRLATTFKIQNDVMHCPLIKSKPTPAPDRQQRTHNRQLNRVTALTEYGANAFLPRTVTELNDLPAPVVYASSVNIFVCYLPP